MIDIWQNIRNDQAKQTAYFSQVLQWHGDFMLIVLLGAGNGLIHAFEASSSDMAMNSIKIFPGRTSKSYDGLKEGKESDSTMKMWTSLLKLP